MSVASPRRCGPPALPDRGRREGDGLDAADRPRQRRARVDAAPRQRSDHARRGRGPHSSRHEWPVQLTPTMRVLLGAVGELAGTGGNRGAHEFVGVMDEKSKEKGFDRLSV